MKPNPYTVIDLFCGAGGTTTGIHLSGKAKVIACINHDETAIKSHAANYPDCNHYIEDIRLFNVAALQKCDIITMSAECTHFSIAKGGESRNADSRTLSEELYRYIAHCEPKAVIVENVKEFLSWSDLVQKTDKKGNLVCKPNGEPYMIPDTDNNKRGSKYLEWVKTIKAMGYEYQSRVLNSADFGAYTSRVRYFGIFVKKGCEIKIKFPQPTHAKQVPKGSHIHQWKAVKDLLDFSDKGKSIFNREKPLCEKTLKRIYAGLQKFVPISQKEWIIKYLSNSPTTGVNRGATVNEPLHTITTQSRLGLCSLEFIDEYKTDRKPSAINQPLSTITTQGGKGLVSCAFLDKYYGIANAQSIDKPCDTITTVDRHSLIQPLFIEKAYSNCVPQSIDRPCDSITTVNKMNLIQAAYSGENLVVNEKDSPYTKLIKMFMAEYGIVDIYQRMLNVDTELKPIQGFPKDYVLLGTQTQRTKFVGNSVNPDIMKAIFNGLLN